MKNKGKREMRKIGGNSYLGYHCNRCGVWIPAENWNNDTHKNCGEYFKTKDIRERAEKRATGNMGKLLMLLLLFIPLFLNALNLKMTYNLEMGYLPKGIFKTYEDEYLKDQLCFSQVFYTSLESYFHLKSFYIGGEIETVMKKLKHGYTFSPERSTYKMAFGFNFDGVEVGFRHYCIHPTLPYINPDLHAEWKGSYEEIFIRFSGKTGR